MMPQSFPNGTTIQFGNTLSSNQLPFVAAAPPRALTTPCGRFSNVQRSNVEQAGGCQKLNAEEPEEHLVAQVALAALAFFVVFDALLA
jgi:hypothetical protein